MGDANRARDTKPARDVAMKNELAKAGGPHHHHRWDKRRRAAQAWSWLGESRGARLSIAIVLTGDVTIR
jgi:hypothetical protein